MKGAFVLRLSSEARPDRGVYQGWIEEIDSGLELRFHSADELLRFVAERFHAALESHVDDSEGQTTQDGS